MPILFPARSAARLLSTVVIASSRSNEEIVRAAGLAGVEELESLMKGERALSFERAIRLAEACQTSPGLLVRAVMIEECTDALEALDGGWRRVPTEGERALLAIYRDTSAYQEVDLLEDQNASDRVAVALILGLGGA